MQLNLISSSLSLQALCGVLQAAGKRITEKHRGEMRETLVALQSTAQDSNRLEAAKCLGLLCAYLPDDELSALLEVPPVFQHYLMMFTYPLRLMCWLLTPAQNGVSCSPELSHSRLLSSQQPLGFCHWN